MSLSLGLRTGQCVPTSLVTVKQLLTVSLCAIIIYASVLLPVNREIDTYMYMYNNYVYVHVHVHVPKCKATTTESGMYSGRADHTPSPRGRGGGGGGGRGRWSCC